MLKINNLAHVNCIRLRYMSFCRVENTDIPLKRIEWYKFKKEL